MTAATNMVHCQLWMGGLEPYMTESFILQSFQRMGEKPLNVKVMRNKYTGEPAGYCFVHFENDDEAIDAMHKLNGKIIPGTNPAVRFRLNTASNQGKIMMNEREFSLWVGDLSPEVDDYTLFKCFAAKYQSIKAAKVILDASGYSKGFGFLRFGLEEEQKHCLNHMNGYKGLGSKPLKISNAIPKSQRSGPPNGPQMNQQGANYQYPPDYSHYYDPNYWQNYGQWGNYGYDPSGGGGGYSTGYDPNSAAYAQYGGQYPAQYGGQYPNQYGSYPPPTGGYPHPPYPGYYPPQTPAAGPPPPTAPVTSVPPPTAATAPVDDANEVVEHSTPVDVEKENREYADAILNYWVDLASNYGTSKDIFEDEMSKLNVVEVSNPSVTIKFETRLAAKRAVEAQGQEGLMGSASSDSSDSEEPDAKKRRLSADAKSSDESGKESSVKKEDAEVTNEAEDGVTVRQEQVTKDSDELAERINAEDVEATFDVNTEKVEDAEAKEKMKTECGKVFGFMASVDVDIMMNETERVSSDSSGDSSDSDGEGDSNQKGKVKKSKSKEKPEDKMNTDSAEKSSANNERGDAGESQPDRTGDVTKEDDVATSNGDKMATSVAEEAAEDLRQENVFIDEMKEMSETSDGEQTDRVNIQPVIEEPGNTVDETGQLARETPNPELASKSPKSAADQSEDQSEAFITVEECFDGSPDAEPLNVQPSSIIDCDGESNNSLDELAKADPTSEFTFDTLLNGQEGYSPKEDQSLSNSPQQVQNLDSSEESD